jgi:hypothetical protein
LSVNEFKHVHPPAMFFHHELEEIVVLERIYQLNNAQTSTKPSNEKKKQTNSVTLRTYYFQYVAMATSRGKKHLVQAYWCLSFISKDSRNVK